MTIHPIDLHFRNTPGLIAAWLLKGENECALIETGPGSCHTALVDGLRAHGVSPSDVRQVLVTHIHLDHAGGAGWWAQQGAQVYVHSRGAAHLIDPSKLIDSATRIYGDQMDTLWGSMLPAPADRVTVLNDGDEVAFEGQRIIAWDTPGHARHHHVFVLDDVCFTGDVAGVRLEGSNYISVAAAPPQFEPVPYVQSVERLMSGNFQKLYLTHFGEVSDARDHLEQYRQRIRDVHAQVAEWVSDDKSSDEVATRYSSNEHNKALAQGVSEVDWQRYELANGSAMCASGVELYVKKHG
jgi:glyoxylase-like metal-dependent hydrolase (beta-lactamase superfamily II)